MQEICTKYFNYEGQMRAMFEMLWVDPDPVLVILTINRMPGRLTRTGTEESLTITQILGRLTRTGTEESYPFGLLMTCPCTAIHTRTQSVRRPCSVTERPLFPIHIYCGTAELKEFSLLNSIVLASSNPGSFLLYFRRFLKLK